MIELWGKELSKLHWANTQGSGVFVLGVFQRCRSETVMLWSEMLISQLLCIRHLN